MSETIYPRVVNLPFYVGTIKHDLKPPVSNKIMFDGSQLKIMIVGGPNQRDDFHFEDGEELFVQLIGSMDLQIMDNRDRRSIPINEMETFLLPSHVSHSPQRFANTIGIVIERTRMPSEIDKLIWYYPGTTNSESNSKAGEVLYEESFYCQDLGTQLKPVIERFFASEKYEKYVKNVKPLISLYDFHSNSTLSAPVSITNEINCITSSSVYNGMNKQEYIEHEIFNSEFKAILVSRVLNASLPVTTINSLDVFSLNISNEGDIFLWQLKHSSCIYLDDKNSYIELNEGDVCLLSAKERILSYPKITQMLTGSILFVVTNKTHIS